MKIDKCIFCGCDVIVVAYYDEVTGEVEKTPPVCPECEELIEEHEEDTNGMLQERCVEFDG